MEFNDGNQWNYVVDPNAYMRSREMYEYRACSAKDVNGVFSMYQDTRFDEQRARMSACQGLLFYQFPYQDFTPEAQADYFCNIIGTLRSNEMVMLDTEEGSGLTNPADFANRWLTRVEARLNTLAWVYVPRTLSAALSRKVTGNRIVKAPRYSGDATIGLKPNWSYDVHQYSDKGLFPGSDDGIGDVNVTTWSVSQLLARCQGAAGPIGSARRRRAYPLLGT